MREIKPQLNYVPVDLAKKNMSFDSFTPDSNPAYNDAMTPKFNGRLAEKNFTDLVTNDDIRNKDADYIIGGRLFDAIVDVNGGGDYLTIQEAINSGKNRIFLRNGTYTISSTITVYSSNFIILGESKDNSIIKIEDSVANDFKAISVGNGTTAYSNIVIENLSVDGNIANQGASTGQSAINIDKCSDVRINNCNFYDIAGSGININDADVFRVFIENCYFTNTLVYAISIAGGAYSMWVVNNYMYTTTTNGPAIQVTSPSSNIIILNNLIDGYQDGVSLTGADKNIVSNNIIKNQSADGIYFNSSKYNNIIGNNIESVGENGINGDNLQYSTISQNVIKDSSQDTNNTYSDILLAGLGVGQHCVRNTITGNVIRATNANKSKYSIEEEDANQDYNIISNNVCDGAVTASILLSGANSIKSNNIE